MGRVKWQSCDPSALGLGLQRSMQPTADSTPLPASGPGATDGGAGLACTAAAQWHARCRASSGGGGNPLGDEPGRRMLLLLLLLLNAAAAECVLLSVCCCRCHLLTSPRATSSCNLQIQVGAKQAVVGGENECWTAVGVVG